MKSKIIMFVFMIGLLVWGCDTGTTQSSGTTESTATTIGNDTSGGYSNPPSSASTTSTTTSTTTTTTTTTTTILGPVKEVSVSSLSEYLSNLVLPSGVLANIQITDKKPDLAVIAQALQDNECRILLYLDLSKATDLTEIGAEAFSGGCSSLMGITIPDSVKVIGNSAFSGCPYLGSVNYTGTIEDWCGIKYGNSSAIPFDSHPIVHNLYIRGQLVTDLVIPNTVTEIKPIVFCNCKGLINVTIPNSVTKIGDGAFSYCSGLTSVVIPDSVSSIGNTVFQGCTGLINVTIPDSVTSIGNSAFSYCRSLTSITIPDGVTSIGDGAFKGCSGLTSITIPDGVTSIGDSAFSGCSSLTSITIPDSVTSIGVEAFENCSGLTRVDYIGTIEQWCGIIFSTIGSSFSLSCNPLNYAHNLYINGEIVTDLVIPNTVTKINDFAFVGCSGLTSVTIPDSVWSIGRRAFLRCSGLTSIEIPDSVTSIGYYAFYGCSGLTTLFVKATTPPSVESSLNSTLTAIYVPAASVAAYKSADRWKEYADIIQAITE